MEQNERAAADLISVPPDPLIVRHRFASHLSGEGIEIGPGHVPFPVPPTLSIRYVDRWEPTANSSLFPELGESPGFPEPDVISNLDSDRLAMFPEASQDFVIASHVLEHLANPLAMLKEIYRVLRPGGLLVLLIPDRHRTFDCDRSPTPLAHLVDEYERDVHEVDDAHILDFLIGTQEQLDEHGDADRSPLEFTPEEIELHRRRSVHVHVWDVEEFGEFMNYSAKELRMRWKVIDTMPPDAEGSYGNEFGWVLKKTEVAIPSGRFRRFWGRTRHRP
jgi:SAM-dependent methyltransferase